MTNRQQRSRPTRSEYHPRALPLWSTGSAACHEYRPQARPLWSTGGAACSE